MITCFLLLCSELPLEIHCSLFKHGTFFSFGLKVSVYEDLLTVPLPSLNIISKA